MHITRKKVCFLIATKFRNIKKEKKTLQTIKLDAFQFSIVLRVTPHQNN